MAENSITTVSSQQEFNEFVKLAGSSLVVVHFLAEWAPQCQQVTDVLVELAKDKATSKVKFVQLGAEEVPEVSMEFEIEAVPTVVLVRLGKVVDRVNGVKIAELTKTISLHAKDTVFLPTNTTSISNEDLEDRLKRLVRSTEVMVFMKGDPDEPRCGFSRQLVTILNEKNVRFGSFDILSDEEVRQGLKKFSNWPTYPQVYVKGELVGGIDVIKELIESGEFEEQFPKQEPLDNRLKKLINSASIMLFMKGNPQTPRCGFSRQVVDLLQAKGVKFESFDILQDEEVRQGLKEYSKWPTYPQLYAKGELVGGIDILREMESNGEIDEIFTT